jgi:hypothetical protein
VEINKLLVMPHDDYLNAEGLNSSGISMLKRSAKYYKYWLGKKRTPTPAMEFGTLTHTILFEKGAVNRLSVEPDVNKRTNAGKAELEAFRASQPSDAIIVDRDDYEKLMGMYESLISDKDAMDLMDGGIPEVSIFWEEQEVLMKARADLLCGKRIIDLKTTERADPYNFEKSVASFGYYIQGVHYLSGFNAEEFFFLAIEKDAPYQIAIYQLDQAAIEIGEIERNRAIKKYKECTKTGIWPGFSGIQPISVPHWLMNNVCKGE